MPGTGKAGSVWRLGRTTAIAVAAAWLAGLLAASVLSAGGMLAALQLLRVGSVMGIAVVILLLCFLAGRRLMRRAGLACASRAEEAAFSTALGLGCLSLLVLAVGLVGGLRSSVAYGLLAAGALLLVPGSLRRRGEPRGPVHRDGVTLALAGILVAGALVYLPGTFAPPLNYDSLTYHAGIPNLFVRHHRILNVPHNVYAQFPFGMEMLYTLALLVQGDTLAKLLHFSAGLLTAAGMVGLACRHFGPGPEGRWVGLTAAVLFYTTPLVGLLSGWLFNELGLALFQVLSLAALLNYLYPRGAAAQRGWLRLCGVLAGLSLSVKLSAGPLSCAALVAVLAVSGFARRRGAGAVLRDAAVLVGFCLLAASPWLVKSAIYTGNPVYPFLGGVFGPLSARLGVGGFDAQRFMAAHLPPDISVAGVLGLLKRLVTSRELGPALALFLPLAALARGPRGPVAALAGYGACSFLVWVYATHQEPRFLVGALPALYTVAACGIVRLGSQRVTRPLVAGAVAVVCVLNLFWVVAHVDLYGYQGFVTGRQDRREYLLTFAERFEGGLYQYPAFDYVNRVLPLDARILFVGENQGYYCDRDFVGASPFDTNPIVLAANRAGSAAGVAAWLQDEGFTHLLVNGSELSRALKTVGDMGWKGPEARDAFVGLFAGEEHLVLLFRSGSVAVYEIR